LAGAVACDDVLLDLPVRDTEREAARPARRARARRGVGQEALLRARERQRERVARRVEPARLAIVRGHVGELDEHLLARSQAGGSRHDELGAVAQDGREALAAGDARWHRHEELVLVLAHDTLGVGHLDLG
jgi:phage shock protein A